MIVGLTSGTFDLFHHSHLIYLERCKALCDRLLVGVDSDNLASATKGDLRPIYSQLHRLNMLNSLTVVDMAFILSRVEDLTKIAKDFNVTKVFKCGSFDDNKKGRVYGTETAELVILNDVPGMISTTAVIEAIKDGQTRLGPLPVTGYPIGG